MNPARSIAWSRRLVNQLLALDAKLLPHMGFPADWQQRPLWKHLLGDLTK